MNTLINYMPAIVIGLGISAVYLAELYRNYKIYS
jgi:multisubunit Na+/H+ antiporter MnhC subunit